MGRTKYSLISMRVFLFIGLLCLWSSLEGLAIPVANSGDNGDDIVDIIVSEDTQDEENDIQDTRHQYGGSNYYRPSSYGYNYNRPSYYGYNNYRPSYYRPTYYPSNNGFGNGIIPTLGAGLAGAAVGGALGNTLNPTTTIPSTTNTGVLGNILGLLGGRSIQNIENRQEEVLSVEEPVAEGEEVPEGEEEAEEALNQYLKACSNYNYGRPSYYYPNYNSGGLGNLVPPFLGGAAVGGILGLLGGRSLDAEEDEATYNPQTLLDPEEALNNFLQTCSNYDFAPSACRPTTASPSTYPSYPAGYNYGPAAYPSYTDVYNYGPSSNYPS